MATKSKLLKTQECYELLNGLDLNECGAASEDESEPSVCSEEFDQEELGSSDSTSDEEESDSELSETEPPTRSILTVDRGHSSIRLRSNRSIRGGKLLNFINLEFDLSNLFI